MRVVFLCTATDYLVYDVHNTHPYSKVFSIDAIHKEAFLSGVNEKMMLTDSQFYLNIVLQQ